MTDDRVMSLVEFALRFPAEEREARLKTACLNDVDLYTQVWTYVQAEERMKGFLLEPIYSLADPNLQHLQPGELLEDRFRIVREISQGGMGVVYEALDERLHRVIALKCSKVLHARQLDPEVRHASEISHPHICKIYEIHTASTPRGTIDFLTMEFLDGETLFQRLRRGALPEPEARLIARQICSGVAEAHRRGVIHGDLKTANIIVTTDVARRTTEGSPTRAVITDFGLARPLEHLPAVEAVQGAGGTPAYMAPELWSGQKPSVASDIFALGVILYEMLAGHKPHDLRAQASETEGTRTATPPTDSVLFWEKRLQCKVPPVHRKWDRILARCLETDPARRFGSTDELVRALGPSMTRRRIITAAAVVVIAAASGWITYQRAMSPKETVRLTLLPFDADTANAATARTLLADTSARIGAIGSSPRTRFNFLPFKSQASQAVDTRLRATHVMSITVASASTRVAIHAFIRDTHSGVNVREWSAEYETTDLRYTPAALTSIVTWTFGLRPLKIASIRAEALKSYRDGLKYLRNRSGEIDAAVAELQRAVARDGESPLTHAALAEAEWFKYYQSRDKTFLDRSTESARQAALRNPDLAEVHRIVGLLTYNSGKYEQAQAEYLRAIELESQSSEGWRRLGSLYQKRGQLDEALAAFKRAVELEPDYYVNYQNLGSFYFSRGERRESLPYLMKAVQLAPGEPAAHFALGANYQTLGDYSQAEHELRLSISLKETAPALHELGYMLMFQAKDDEAVPYFQRSLELSGEQYPSSLSWMYLGIAWRRLHQPTEARSASIRGLALAESAVTRDPRSAYDRSFLAYLCTQVGDRRRAEVEIEQSLRLSPEDVDVRANAVLVYEAVGRRADTLRVATSFSAEELARTNSWPDLADLQKDPRFIQLLLDRHVKFK
jgi:serine/threonine protein kinase/tetratricopeptide (TPR) repeat protein